MSKKDKIEHVCRKHSSWKKVLFSFLEYDENLDIDLLIKEFKFFIDNKQVFKNHFGIDDAKKLIKIEDDRSIIERFHDALHSIHLNHEKEQFIRSLKSRKYKKIINKKIEKLIIETIESGISIQMMKSQFFNKLALYKTSDEVWDALKKFRKNNSKWCKYYYKKIINKKNFLGRIIIEKENELIVSVYDYNACKKIGASAWCITQSKHYFDHYAKSGQQIIKLNFSLPASDPHSMIGYSMTPGNYCSNSYLRNDSVNVSKAGQNLNVPKMEIKDIIGMAPYRNDDFFANIIKQCKTETILELLNNKKSNKFIFNNPKCFRYLINSNYFLDVFNCIYSKYKCFFSDKVFDRFICESLISHNSKAIDFIIDKLEETNYVRWIHSIKLSDFIPILKVFHNRNHNNKYMKLINRIVLFYFNNDFPSHERYDINLFLINKKIINSENLSNSIKKIMIKKGIFDTSLNLKFNKSEAKMLLINALKANRHFSDFGAFNCLNNANVDIKEICKIVLKFDSEITLSSILNHYHSFGKDSNFILCFFIKHEIKISGSFIFTKKTNYDVAKINKYIEKVNDEQIFYNHVKLLNTLNIPLNLKNLIRSKAQSNNNSIDNDFNDKYNNSLSHSIRGLILNKDFSFRHFLKNDKLLNFFLLEYFSSGKKLSTIDKLFIFLTYFKFEEGATHSSKFHFDILPNFINILGSLFSSNSVFFKSTNFDKISNKLIFNKIIQKRIKRIELREFLSHIEQFNDKTEDKHYFSIIKGLTHLLLDSPPHYFFRRHENELDAIKRIYNLPIKKSLYHKLNKVITNEISSFINKGKIVRQNSLDIIKLIENKTWLKFKDKKIIKHFIQLGERDIESVFHTFDFSEFSKDDIIELICNCSRTGVDNKYLRPLFDKYDIGSIINNEWINKNINHANPQRELIHRENLKKLII